MVESMSAMGIQYKEISRLVGIDVNTLMKHYPDELANGATKANFKVIERLYKRAVDEGDTAACIWWTKARLGWSETRKQEITGANGGPVEQCTTTLNEETAKRIIADLQKRY